LRSVYKQMIKECVVCGNGFYTRPSVNSSHCSLKCVGVTFQSKYSGKGNPNYKGKMKLKRGYERVSIGNGKTDMKHRLVWKKHYGPIPEGKIIHHKNGIKTDNHIENLQLMSQREHIKIHMDEIEEGKQRYWKK